ncbi:MAG: hypothetical protein JXB30_01975 [Anaerolineae bacterium]|nr:hypothetical protein [Anaerolineae bacterium]
MAATLIILAFCIAITWLIYRFPLRNAKEPADYRKLLLFFGVIILFLVFNTLLALAGYGGLGLAVTGTPLTSTQALSDISSGDGVILVGEISPDNRGIYSDYAAYQDETHLWSPDELWIDLDDGTIAVTNDTYRATGWPVDAMGYTYLRAGQPVVAVGYLERNTTLVSRDDSLSVRADIVYAGSLDDFRSRARINRLLAAALVIVNGAVVIVVVVLPVRRCLIGMRKGIG